MGITLHGVYKADQCCDTIDTAAAIEHVKILARANGGYTKSMQKRLNSLEKKHQELLQKQLLNRLK